MGEGVKAVSSSHTMDGFRLTAKQIARLKREQRRQRDKRMAYRLKAIILPGSGWSVTEVAEALLVAGRSTRCNCARASPKTFISTTLVSNPKSNRVNWLRLLHGKEV